MLQNEVQKDKEPIPIPMGGEDNSLLAMVERAFTEAENNAVNAAALLEQWAKQDPALAKLILDPHLPSACWDLVTAQCRRNRSLIWGAPQYDVSGRGERVAYLAIENAKFLLLDMPLPIKDEPLLRNATKEQVIEAAVKYEKISANMIEKAVLLRLIAKTAKDGATIGAQFTEAALRKLQAIAKGEKV